MQCNSALVSCAAYWGRHAAVLHALPSCGAVWPLAFVSVSIEAPACLGDKSSGPCFWGIFGLNQPLCVKVTIQAYHRLRAVILQLSIKTCLHAANDTIAFWPCRWLIGLSYRVVYHRDPAPSLKRKRRMPFVQDQMHHVHGEIFMADEILKIADQPEDQPFHWEDHDWQKYSKASNSFEADLPPPKQKLSTKHLPGAIREIEL